METAEKGINGCIVKTFVENEAIGKDGRISVGDYLLSINNESLRHVTNAQARAILRRASQSSADIRYVIYSLLSLLAGPVFLW